MTDEPKPPTPTPTPTAAGTDLTIRTSEKGWLARLTQAYRRRAPLELIDDAGAGIDPAGQNLVEMGRRAGLSRREWAAVIVSLGLGGAGAAMVLGAILDPEPTSKLGLLVGGGTLCLLGGGFSAIRILTHTRPPSVDVGPRGFRIRWD